MPPGTGSADLQKHRVLVVDALLKGRVVPFLGAGVNLCDRPSGTVWNASEERYLPKGWELAEYLAERFHYPSRRARRLNRSRHPGNRCTDPRWRP